MRRWKYNDSEQARLAPGGWEARQAETDTLNKKVTAGRARALRWKCFRVIWGHQKEVFYLSAWCFGSRRWNEDWTGHQSCSLSLLFPFTKAVSQSPNCCQQCLPSAGKIKRRITHFIIYARLTQCEGQRRIQVAKLRKGGECIVWPKAPMFSLCLGCPSAQGSMGRACWDL